MATNDFLAEQLTALLARLPKEDTAYTGESDVDSNDHGRQYEQQSLASSNSSNNHPRPHHHHHHSLLHLEVKPGEVSLGERSFASILSARSQNSRGTDDGRAGRTHPGKRKAMHVSFISIFLFFFIYSEREFVRWGWGSARAMTGATGTYVPLPPWC